MWEQKLGLEIQSREHPTRTSSGAQEDSLWFRFLGELRTDDVRSSRRNPMFSPSEKIAENLKSLVPMCPRALDLMDRFLDDLRRHGKLRAENFGSPELVAFLEDKRKEALEIKTISEQAIIDSETSSDSMVTVDDADDSISIGASAVEKTNAFVDSFFDAPETHQRACVEMYLRKHTTNDMFALGNRGRPNNYFKQPLAQGWIWT